METTFKLLIFLLFFASIAIVGYKVYVLLNSKINSSNTWWQLLGFTVLLFSIYILLLFGGLFALIEAYGFLVENT